jgi:antitoxin (DNA-binding transcriptional repressor) of toxin-antitoxin stability system
MNNDASCIHEVVARHHPSIFDDRGNADTRPLVTNVSNRISGGRTSPEFACRTADSREPDVSGDPRQYERISASRAREAKEALKKYFSFPMALRQVLSELRGDGQAIAAYKEADRARLTSERYRVAEQLSRRLTDWTKSECASLAERLLQSTGQAPWDVTLVAGTLARMGRDMPWRTHGELIQGLDIKSLRRAIAENANRVEFTFTNQHELRNRNLEALLSLPDSFLLSGKRHVEAALRVKYERDGLVRQIQVLDSRLRDYEAKPLEDGDRARMREVRLERHMFKSAVAAIESPDDVVVRQSLHEASEKWRDFQERRLKPREALAQERLYFPSDATSRAVAGESRGVTSAAEHRPLLSTSIAISAAMVASAGLNGVHRYESAVATGVYLAASKLWDALFGQSPSVPAANEADPPSLLAERSSDLVEDLLAHTTHMISRNGKLQLQTTLLALEAIFGSYPGTPDANDPILQQKIFTLLREDGLLDMLVRQASHLVTDMNDATASAKFPGSEVSLREHHRVTRGASFPGSALATMVAEVAPTASVHWIDDAPEVVAALMAQLMEVVRQGIDEARRQEEQHNERLYFLAMQKAWRGDPELHWISRASEEKQNIYLQLAENYVYQRQEFQGRLRSWEKQREAEVIELLDDCGLVDVWPEELTLAAELAFSFGNQNVSLPATIILDQWHRAADHDWLDNPGLLVYFQDGEGELVFLSDAQRQQLVDGLKKVTVPDWKVEARRVIADAAVRQLHYQMVHAHFNLAALTADLKGELTGGPDAWVKGLDVIAAAQSGEQGVRVGQLEFLGAGAATGISVPLYQWLMLSKYDMQGREDGVVLYDARSTWRYFKDQNAMRQYLDWRRLGQEVAASVLPSAVLNHATSADRAKLVQHFERLQLKPSKWNESQLTFVQWPRQTWAKHLEMFSGNLLDQEAKHVPVSPAMNRLSSKLLRVEVAWEDATATRLPTLDEFSRRYMSRVTAPFLVAKGVVSNVAEVDASTVHIEFNGVKGSLAEWGLSLYRRHGDAGNFSKEAKVSSTVDSSLNARFNREDVKAGLEAVIRTSYPGDAYGKGLKDLRADTGRLRELFMAAETARLELAVEQGRVSGYVEEGQYARLRALLNVVPAKAALAGGSIDYFTVNGIRVPGMYSMTLYSRSGLSTRTHFSERYVYSPDAPYGQWLYREEDFTALLKTSHSTQALIQNRTLVKDHDRMEEALRGASASSFRLGVMSLNRFRDVFGRFLDDRLEDVDALTTSRGEMIRDAAATGVRLFTLPVCLASGPAAIVACAAGTTYLVARDATEVWGHLRRGRINAALQEALFLGLDIVDIGAGVNIVAKGVKGLLAASGRTSFKAVVEVSDALQVLATHQRSFLPNGRLNPELALANADLLVEGRPGKPRAGLAGDFWSIGSNWYIRDRQHVYQVYSDGGWMPDTIRVRDPHHPQAQGTRIIFEHGQWQESASGLRAGTGRKRAAMTPTQLAAQERMRSKKVAWRKESLEQRAIDAGFVQRTSDGELAGGSNSRPVADLTAFRQRHDVKEAMDAGFVKKGSDGQPLLGPDLQPVADLPALWRHRKQQRVLNAGFLKKGSDGQPEIGLDGQPIADVAAYDRYTDARAAISAGFVKKDSDGQPMVGDDGRPIADMNAYRRHREAQRAIHAGFVEKGEDGQPVVGDDGRPRADLFAYKQHCDAQAAIRAGFVRKGSDGQPLMGDDGQPMADVANYRRQHEAQAAIHAGFVKRGSDRQPLIGDDGRPLADLDAYRRHNETQTAIKAGFVKKMSDGRPLIGDDGRPMADVTAYRRNLELRKAISAGFIKKGSDGQPTLGGDGKPVADVIAYRRHLEEQTAINAGFIKRGPDGRRPMIGPDGKPVADLIVYRRSLEEQAALKRGFVKKGSDGQPLIGNDGRPMADVSAYRRHYETQSAIQAGFVEKGSDGQPVIGDDGQLKVDLTAYRRRVEEQAAVNAGFVRKRPDGRRPMFGPDGRAVADVTAYRRHLSEQTALNAGFVKIGSDGRPVVGLDGKPVADPAAYRRYLDERAAIHAGYIKKGSDGQPLMGADGKPLADVSAYRRNLRNPD